MKEFLENLKKDEEFYPFIKKVEKMLSFKIGIVENRKVEKINKLSCYRLDFAFENDHFSVCDPRFKGRASISEVQKTLPEGVYLRLFDNGTLSLEVRIKEIKA